MIIGLRIGLLVGGGQLRAGLAGVLLIVGGWGCEGKCGWLLRVSGGSGDFGEDEG
jgi:hypothetical protein